MGSGPNPLVVMAIVMIFGSTLARLTIGYFKLGYPVEGIVRRLIDVVGMLGVILVVVFALRQPGTP